MVSTGSTFPPPPEVRNLAVALWAFGFVVMVLGAAPNIGLVVAARFALLSGLGVALSTALWILVARGRGERPGVAIALLCLGVLAAWLHRSEWICLAPVWRWISSTPRWSGR